MSTLAAFLLARIAEDEAAARRIHYESCGTPAVTVPDSMGRPMSPVCDCDWHIARVLAECEAKRRIVEQYEHYRSTIMAYRSSRWRDAMNDQDKQNWHQAEARHAVAEDFVRLLALPYAEHPDMPKDPSQPEG